MAMTLAPQDSRISSVQVPAGATVSTSVRASKTWVLPPRAKPGRKSKKAEVVTQIKVDDENADFDDGDKNVSRIKQKASRERKQEYIVELEAKLRAYEQGDGERASFFQNLAKKHSEENEALKAENEALRQKIAAYEARLKDLPQPSTNPSNLTRKASTTEIKGSRVKRQRTRSHSNASSTSSTSAIFLPSSTPIDPVASNPYHPISHHSPYASINYVRDNTPSLSLSPSSTYLPPSPSLSATFSPLPAPMSIPQPTSTSSCGMCADKSGPGDCICEDIGVGRPSVSKGCGGAGKVSCGLCDDTATSMCICEDIGIGRPNAPSKLDRSIEEESVVHKTSSTVTKTNGNSSALPLKLAKKGVAYGKIWRLDNDISSLDKPAVPSPALSVPLPLKNPASTPTSPAAAAGVALRRRLIKVGSRLPCSGDPRTCPACADDPAGQAFCSALSNTVCSTNPCATCPSKPSPLANEVRAHPSLPTSVNPIEAAARIALRRRDSSARDEVPKAMIPCSDAWATLREHPNIGFANLDLLASVVAKRTVCSGGEKHDANGKIKEVGREGVEEALDMLDHVRD